MHVLCYAMLCYGLFLMIVESIKGILVESDLAFCFDMQNRI